MSRPWRAALLALCTAAWVAAPSAQPAGAVAASTAQRTAPAAPAASSASAAPAAPATAAARAASEVRVIEDDQVRIEETRIRGQVQRITVTPKGPPGSAPTMRPYEILVGAGGRDPSQDKSAAGQRVWSVLRF